MQEYSAFVGLDVHKETIAVAVADAGVRLPTHRTLLPICCANLVDGMHGCIVSTKRVPVAMDFTVRL